MRIYSRLGTVLIEQGLSAHLVTIPDAIVDLAQCSECTHTNCCLVRYLNQTQGY
jgi:hypothetical protein